MPLPPAVVFGRVLEGWDVVLALQEVPTDRGARWGLGLREGVGVAAQASGVSQVHASTACVVSV